MELPKKKQYGKKKIEIGNGNDKKEDRSSPLSKRNKFPLTPFDVAQEKLLTANFDSLPKFTEAILSEYLNRIRELEIEVEEFHEENKVLADKL